MTAIGKIPTQRALAFVAKHMGVEAASLTVRPVTGGYSLNRRAIVSANGSYVFVKEVDETLVGGDGEQERSWLAKDHSLTSLLRDRGFASVASWSKLSDDRNILLLPAYRPEEGWLWELPQDDETRQQYIEVVLATASNLEELRFTDKEEEQLRLSPYFRDKIAEDASLPGLDDLVSRDLIVEKCDRISERAENQDTVSRLNALRAFVNDTGQQDQVKKMAAQLRNQPNGAFGHCDLRSDNLAYHPVSRELVLVDWNWASYVPQGFGATEFLINVAKQGVDVTEWAHHLNRPLVAALVGFWLRAGLKPNLGETSHLRDHQIIAAAESLRLLLTH